MANTAPVRYLQSIPQNSVGVWDKTITIAEANSGAVIVPNQTGYLFVPTAVMFKCIGGNATGPTTLHVYDTSSASLVVMSHVTADCTDGTWVFETGGTVVTTKLRAPSVSGYGVSFGVAGGSALSVAVTVRVVVSGFYMRA
jgi:hypothetical protein